MHCAVLLGLTFDLTFEHHLRSTGKLMNHGHPRSNRTKASP